MKKALQYGAGNIGRGFIGQLLSESGYEVVFVEINKAVINKINQDKKYPIKVVSEHEQKEIYVNNVSAVDAADTAKVVAEISECSIMATAVGVNVLPKIVPNPTFD